MDMNYNYTNNILKQDTFHKINPWSEYVCICLEHNEYKNVIQRT